MGKEKQDGLPEGDWPGREVDWNSTVSTARLHVELPFWIAAPDGKVRITIANCSLDIDYRNHIVGIYRNSVFHRDERSLFQLTAEGFPFWKEQANELANVESYGERHFRTMLTIPVRCHEGVFELLDSKDERKIRDARIYVQSLAHASIRFINEFISAYRAASFDPFVTHISHWDVPVWHISNTERRIWSVPMASYPVADELPAADPLGRLKFRTTEGRIREAALMPLSTSTEELLDAWACFYRGQFAEAIRKAVTAIEVAISHLLSELPAFRQGRDDDEVQAHLVKTKFSDQFSFYLRETKRQLPGPLTHIAPEVNGVYLKRELDAARERRHKIVHESEKVDYEHDGPILRIMETMSWLHGWLCQADGRSDPTRSPWHPANKQMRDVFPLEPIADDRGLGLVVPEPRDFDGDRVLIEDVYTAQLLHHASAINLDISYCVAWAFQALQEPLIDGRRVPEASFHQERFWMREGEALRPVFLVSTSQILTQEGLNSIAFRTLMLKRKHSNCGQPIVVVNHLSQIEDNKRVHVTCISASSTESVEELGFTVVSLMDWVAITCLLTQHRGREFSFRTRLNEPGLFTFDFPGLQKVGYVRRVFPSLRVASIVVEKSYFALGDEICVRSGCESFTCTIKSIELNRQPITAALAGSVVGITVDVGFKRMQSDAEVFRVERPRLELHRDIDVTVQLEEPDFANLLDHFSQLPIVLAGFGTYGGEMGS